MAQTFHPTVTKWAWRRTHTWQPPANNVALFKRYCELQIHHATGLKVQRGIYRLHQRFTWGTHEGWMRNGVVKYKPPFGHPPTRNKRPHRYWRMLLADGCGTPMVRQHPTFWFFAMALPKPNKRGGVLVIPDCVLPAHWVSFKLCQYSHYLWKYWERWDCLQTYPDLPDDLIRE